MNEIIQSDQPKEGIAASREKMNEFCQQQVTKSGQCH